MHQVCAERNNDNAVHRPDAGGQAAAPNRSSDMSFESNSKRGSEDHFDSGRTHATGTVTHGSESWGWYEDVHHDTGALSPTNKKGRDFGNEEIDENQELSTSRRGGKRRGLLHFTMSNIKPLMDMVLSKHDQDTSMAVSAPTYVLEESISSQKLWRHTAGNRPPQPVEERAYFEQIWAQNFLQSQVKYQAPLDVLLANSPIHLSPYADGGFSDTADEIVNYNVAYHNPTVFGGGADRKNSNKINEVEVAEATILQRTNNGMSPVAGGNKVMSDSDGTLTVLVKGDNVFGTTVSKSFARPDRSQRIDTISISIASYRVVQPKQRGKKYAQFLVVYREGSFQNTVGVWKRYSDFDALAHTVASGQYGCSECSSILSGIHPLTVDHGEREEKEVLPNALTSWRLLKKRQRWYRCLDAGYLSLKVFLLERFLHDVLFECSDPQILRDFIGVDLLQ